MRPRPLRFLAPLAATLLLLAACDSKDTRRSLSMDGLGAVKIGMTATQAETALGVKLKPRDAQFFEPACWYTSRADGQDPFVRYMVSGEEVVRIDIDKAPPQAVAVVSDKGIGIDTDEAAATAAYGDALKSTPHRYVEGGHYLRVAAPDGARALLFETDAGKVTTFRAGRVPYVDYVERCS